MRTREVADDRVWGYLSCFSGHSPDFSQRRRSGTSAPQHPETAPVSTIQNETPSTGADADVHTLPDSGARRCDFSRRRCPE